VTLFDCRLNGFDVIERNASVTRNKTSMAVCRRDYGYCDDCASPCVILHGTPCSRLMLVIVRCSLERGAIASRQPVRRGDVHIQYSWAGEWSMWCVCVCVCVCVCCSKIARSCGSSCFFIEIPPRVLLSLSRRRASIPRWARKC